MNELADKRLTYSNYNPAHFLQSIDVKIKDIRFSDKIFKNQINNFIYKYKMFLCSGVLSKSISGGVVFCQALL